MSLTRVGVTLGDPGGIGPEVVLSAIQQLQHTFNHQLVIFGSKKLLSHPVLIPYVNEINLKIVKDDQFLSENNQNNATVYFYDCHEVTHEFETGDANALNGQAAYAYITKAVELAKLNKIQAMATGPISKLGLEAAGIPFTGHTTMLKALTNTSDVSMCF